jgi:peroxiredoxin Q/BCP
LGITFNPAEDLKKWREEVGLPSELLCDVDKSVAIAYGAAENADQEKPSRIGIVIGPDGKVVNAYPVDDAAGHATTALGDLS